MFMCPTDPQQAEQEALLAGMMSPPSGYSSGDEELETNEIVDAVQEEVAAMKSARKKSE